MFELETFWHKKCFANNRNDSRKDKILYSVKLQAYQLLMIKKGLDFTFSIVLNLKTFEMEVCLLMGRRREERRKY